MWENIRHEIDPTIAAVASLLMLLPVLWLLAIYLAWWRSRRGNRALPDSTISRIDQVITI